MATNLHYLVDVPNCFYFFLTFASVVWHPVGAVTVAERPLALTFSTKLVEAPSQEKQQWQQAEAK